MLTINELRSKFPQDTQIQERNDDALQATIDAVILESNGYAGIVDTEIRKQAIALHAAHYTRIEVIAQSTIGLYGMPTAIESKDEKIAYASGNYVAGFSSTIYGQRLEKLLSTQYIGGFLI